MDWARAKSILILVLLILNIFLFVNLGYYSSDSMVSGLTISNTVKTLENQGIILECRIPRLNSDPGKLMYSNFEFDRKEVAYALLGKNASTADMQDNKQDNKTVSYGNKKLEFTGSNSFSYNDDQPQGNIDVSNSTEVEKTAKDFMKELNLPVSSYYLDRYVHNTDNSISLLYIEKFKGYLVFNSYVRLTISANGVKSIQCSYKKPDKIINKSGKKIISAYQVLLKEYMGLSSLTITGISMGFKEYSLEQNSKEYYDTPVWRIRTAENGDRFFSSTDGKEIK